MCSYSFDKAVWSCAFHQTDEHFVYAGLGNGEVCACDLRVTSGPVARFAAANNVSANILSLQNIYPRGRDLTRRG